MVAIVQSDPYQALSRKIGYSVGLEFLLRNASALNDLYVENGTVSLADWRTLIRDNFDRNDRSINEIANFFSSLNLIRIYGNELHVLYALDILSILKRFFLNDSYKYQITLQAILTFFILEADGDIFLNCLSANFIEAETKINLETMINFKWKKFQLAFKNPALQKRIWDIISIKSHAINKIGKSKPSSRFGGSGNDPFTRRTDAISDYPTPQATANKSYLDKIIPTRKGWARDLNLRKDCGELSILGKNLLENLNFLKIDTFAFCFWPYEAELNALKINPPAIGTPAINSWDILNAIAKSYHSEAKCQHLTALSNKEVLDILWKIFTLYKAGSIDRGAIRHQVPLYIIKPVITAICIANNYKTPNLDTILDEEYKSEKRMVNFTNIRGTEGAIIFKSKP